LGLDPQQAVSPAPGRLPSCFTPEAVEVVDSSLFSSELPQFGHRTVSLLLNTNFSEVLPQDEHTNSNIGMLIFSFPASVFSPLGFSARACFRQGLKQLYLMNKLAIGLIGRELVSLLFHLEDKSIFFVLNESPFDDSFAPKVIKCNLVGR
jgi:hypothetical protein